uniref:Reverse transcriptase domain-containing protein n=1 Tax=Tanacetum cinerariifolium TaxID=118510 RepID=A0A6L2NV16_TANCI|nr:hypothetical protein [Tanacetum cinerariifolium]
MDREVKRLKRCRILIVKVRWNSKRGHEFTWKQATDTSQSLSSVQSINPQYIEGNIQPAVKGLPSTPDKGIRSSNPLPEGKLIIAKDPEINTQPAGMGLPTAHPDEGTRKTKHLPNGTNIDLKYSGRNIQLTNRAQPSTLITDQSGDGIEDQVDKTQSTRFEMSYPDQNKGKTSSEVKLDIKHLILITFGNFKTLLDLEDELKDESDEEMYEAKEEMDEEAVVEEFSTKSENNRNNYDIAINSVMDNVEKIYGERFEEHTTFLKALNRVSKTLEADFTLKASMQKMAKTKTTASSNITSLTELLMNANLPEILTQMNAFHTSLNSLSLQTRITNVENTQVTTQSDISSIKGCCLAKSSSYTKGESQPMDKDAKVVKVKKEPVQKPQHTEPISITIIMPTAKSNPEVNHIGSLSRPQLTGTVINITPSKEQFDDPPHTTPKDNRGKGIPRDTNKSSCKLVLAFEEAAIEAGVDPSALRIKKGG